MGPAGAADLATLGSNYTWSRQLTLDSRAGENLEAAGGHDFTLELSGNENLNRLDSASNTRALGQLDPAKCHDVAANVALDTRSVARAQETLELGPRLDQNGSR